MSSNSDNVSGQRTLGLSATKHYIDLKTSQRRSKRNRTKCDACIVFLAIMLAGVGVLVSVSSTVVCYYFTINGAEDQELGFAGGLWMVPRDDDSYSLLSCQVYPDGSPFDAYLWTARIMSILAPLLCLFGMLMAYISEVSTTISKRECRLLISVISMVTASAMQALTLMVLESAVCKDNPYMPGDGTCDLGYGSQISLGAVSLMSTATFGLLVTGRKEVEFDTSNLSSPNRTNAMPIDFHENEENMGVAGDDELGGQEDLKIRHGTGRFKFVDIWGRMV